MTSLASREMTEQEMVNTCTAPQMAHLIQVLRQTIRNKDKEIERWVDMVSELLRDSELDPPEPQPEPKPEHPAINGYNRYDYIPVEGIRQPKPEPEPPREPDSTQQLKELTMKFETINGTLCLMVEPTPLQLDSEFPCAVRPIQDDSPMGKLNKEQVDYYYGVALKLCLRPVLVKSIDDRSKFDTPWEYCRYEIIGYPVEDGSAEWALWQMSQGKKVCHKSYTMKTTHCAINDESQVVIFTTPYSVANGGDVVCHADEWLDHRQYGCGVDERTGWQLYEPKPLLADAKVGDLCKTDLDEWIQIDDAPEPPSPILYHFDRPFKGNIIHTEPLAPEGSAEWAWQMMKLGKTISRTDNRKETYVYQDGKIVANEWHRADQQWFLKYAEPAGWQLYEGPAKESKPPKEPDYIICNGCGGSQSVPNPAVSNTAYTTCSKCGGTGYEIKPEPALKVGDWVEYRLDSRIYYGEINDIRDHAYYLSFTTEDIPPDQARAIRLENITRKLSPSEVKISITLEGTVTPANYESFFLKHDNKTCQYTMIRYADLSPADAALVRELTGTKGDKS